MALPGAEVLVYNRFGLPDPARAAVNTDGVVRALLAQLDRPQDARITEPDLPNVEQALGIFLARRANLNEQRKEREALLARLSREEQNKLAPLKPAAGIPRIEELLKRELEVRINRAVSSSSLFLDRLALHWFNHFTVSAAAGFVGMFAGAYDREAIRPMMLGRFEDMLNAATLHPAMLFYLDNRSSIGPGSKRGRGKAHRGLNENLGREILELYAMGVDGGYTQDDVIALAKVLTGWTVNIDEKPPRNGAPRIAFEPEAHEPGSKTILGKTYREDGPGEIKAVLRDLARHPSTARHVTRRLVGHFIEPGKYTALESKLARVYLDTDGDLKAVTRALVTSSEALTAPPAKMRPPIEFLFATARLLGVTPEPPAALKSLRAMGQPFWMVSAPAGWPEERDAWTAPDGLKTRLDWSIQVAAKHARVDVRVLADRAFGPMLSAETRSAIARASSQPQALTLLLMSPEMQRR